jgi:hypothetical protein
MDIDGPATFIKLNKDKDPGRYHHDAIELANGRKFFLSLLYSDGRGQTTARVLQLPAEMAESGAAEELETVPSKTSKVVAKVRQKVRQMADAVSS